MLILSTLRVRTTIAILFAAVACGSHGAPAPANSTPTGTGNNASPYISTGVSSSHQQEVSLAQSGNRMVAAWIGFNAPPSAITTIEYAVSDDAGSTWKSPVTIGIPTEVQALSDPVLAMGPSGEVVLVALGDGPQQAIYMYRMGSAAATFSPPVIVDRVDSQFTSFDKTQLVTTSAGFLVTYSAKGGGNRWTAIASSSADRMTWHEGTMFTNNPVFVAPFADGPLVIAPRSFCA